MAMIVMSRVLQQKIIDKGHKTLLAGAGIANLASWLCFYMLKEKKISIELMAEIGMFGYTPCPTEPVLFNSSNFATCKVTTDIPTIMGLFVGGINADCIGALGAAQIDEHGNINSTKTDEKTVMVGSGGANDVCSAAKDIVVIIPQSKSRLLKNVHYITSPGRHVKTVISTLGVFEKKGSDKVFTLTGYFPSEEKHMDAIMEEIKQKSGWAFHVAQDLKEIEPPTEKEITMLRLFDPDRFFLGELE